ncbi:MG2 domain-containing protein [Gemmatimonadota bacterium]
MILLPFRLTIASLPFQDRIAPKPARTILAGTLAILLGCICACSPRPTEHDVEITGVTPTGITDRFTNITIEFSKPVVPADSVSIMFDRAPVSFDPEIEGRFRWTTTQTLRFMPSEPLRLSTDYQMRISPQITGTSGLVLRGERDYTFNTPHIQIDNISHTIERAEDNPTIAHFSFTVEFNELVDPQEFTSHLELRVTTSAGTRSVPFTVSNSEPGRLMDIRTDRVSLGDGEGGIRMNIHAGLGAFEGTVPLEEDQSETFTFQSDSILRVETIRPEQQGGSYSVVIRFSSPVDPTVAREFITVQPADEVQITEHSRGLRLGGGGMRAGSTVTVNISAGLRAQDGATLPQPFNQPVLLGDLRPALSFTSPGLYLSREGLHNAGIDVVNLETLRLEVEKVYRNNLIHFLHGGNTYWTSVDPFGSRIYEEEIPLTLPRNEIHTVTVNFSEFMDEHPEGLFRLKVRGEGRYWFSQVKSVLLTDIGIIGKRTDDELHVWVLSTSTLEPLDNTDVTLYSTNNQVLGTARTDASGTAVITGLLSHMEEFVPSVVTADRGEEFSFLLFDECEVARADFDVDGRPSLLTGYEAFVYGDRGVYRPGETAHFACIVRSPGLAVPSSFPLRMKVVQPDGRVLEEQQAREFDGGMVGFDSDIPAYAPTGRYQAELYGPAEDPIGTLAFSVEEFIPDRIMVQIETGQASYQIGDTMKVGVTGTMLFGPPAAGRRLDTMVRLEAVPFSPSGYSTWNFGNPELEFSEHTLTADVGELDQDGFGEVEFEIPASLRPPAALRGIVQATVHETGGRAVSNATTVDVHPYPFYLGLRRESDGYAEIGAPQTIEYITLDPDGEPTQPGLLRATFSYLRWRSVLMRDNQGRYRYISEHSEEQLATQEIQTVGSGTVAFTPQTWGQYRVTLTDIRSGSSSTVDFYASGWGYTPWSMEKPGQVDLELDHEVYQRGDEARVLVKAPFPGALILTVEREKVLYSRVHILEENTAEISLRVRPDYLPNVYVTATLVRTREGAEAQTPMRAYGTIPLMVDTRERHLEVNLDTPAELRPKTTLDVEVDLNSAPGQGSGTLVDRAWVTIAAVDQGILQLTDFATPDPLGFFYGKKRLDVITYDLFALLLPELEQSELYSAPAGDRMAMMRLEHLSPITARRVKPVALWSGLLEVDRNGSVHTSFDLPEFNGTLRVMAVAASGNTFGASFREVRVRDPIVMTPTLPRFCAPDDEFRIPVNVFNGTGHDGSFVVSIETSGPAEIIGEDSQEVSVTDGEEIPVSFLVHAGAGAGVMNITLRTEGNGEESTAELEVPVRPPAPRESRTGAGSIAPGGNISFRMPGDWISGTGKYTLTITPFPAVEFSGSLQELLRYPYGCVEQTTSSAFPLLYFKDIAQEVEPSLFETNAPEYYVEEAIRKLVSMQQQGGGFSFWPSGTSVSSWGSIYALHFLSEARRIGYAVPASVFRKGIGYLRSILYQPGSSRNTSSLRASTWSDIQRNRMQTYAVYVLALLDRPERGTMTFLMETQRNSLTPESAFLLAGAFALSGDRTTAMQLLPVSVRPQVSEKETGVTFSSSIRDNAIVLAVLADLDPDNPGVPILVDYLSQRARTGRWGTTQENAWAFLAIGKIMRSQASGSYQGTLTIDGVTRADLSSETMTLSADDLGGKEMGISITGDGNAYYYWEARGIPLGLRFVEEDHGLVIRRRYLNSEGAALRADSLSHGQMVVVEVIMRAPNQAVQNVVINDMLPAGLEVENPRLASRAPLPWMPDDAVEPDYLDIRDDRLLIFLNLPRGTERKFYYAARAVTEGTFVRPPILAECMYDLSLRSVASSGEVRVIRP